MYGNPNSHVFTFDINDALRRIVDHAKKADRYQMTFSERESGETPKPGIYLVKDRGAYLMSAGVPGDIIDSKKNSHFVHYARGHHPDKDPFDSWYVGGDDFGEKIGIDIFDNAILALDAKPNAAGGELRIKVTETQFLFDTFIRKAR